MTDTGGDDEARVLRGLGADAPPPSPALAAAIGAMRPVRTRVPTRALLLVTAIACAYPVAAFAALGTRRDLGALPVAWLIGFGLLWLAGFVIPLAVAFLPRRGQVLPDAGRAGRAALAAVIALVGGGLVLTVDVPGITLLPATTWTDFWPRWRHCISFGLEVSAPLVVVGAVALRRVAVVSVARLGAAVGAAGGALAGLTLHGICPYGGAAHVGLAHGGGVAIGALIGAVWLPLFARLLARAR